MRPKICDLCGHDERKDDHEEGDVDGFASSHPPEPWGSLKIERHGQEHELDICPKCSDTLGINQIRIGGRQLFCHEFVAMVKELRGVATTITADQLHEMIRNEGLDNC